MINRAEDALIDVRVRLAVPFVAGAFCAATSDVSQTGTTVVTSLISSGPPFRFRTGFGYHGKSTPVGSPETAARPSRVMRVPILTKTTKLGMPKTLHHDLFLPLKGPSTLTFA